MEGQSETNGVGSKVRFIPSNKLSLFVGHIISGVVRNFIESG